ncbi:MAG: ribonuclease Y [Candidatus Auribacterota bacterium]|jgi:ribonuclease Y|nr:ribonuclease Y [Candidatus Auribacterota bacterium]
MGQNGLIILVTILAGAAGFFARKYLSEKKIKTAEAQAQQIIAEADKEAKARKREMEIELKDKYLRSKAEFEKETKNRRQELLHLEKRVMQKEEYLDRKVDVLERKELDVNAREKKLGEKENRIKELENEYQKVLEEERKKLQSISGLSRDEAKKLLLDSLESELTQEAASKIRRFEGETKAKADKMARNIISASIQRCCVDHVADITVSSVALPSDEMKGRIIGREGRNIRALEAATGIDIIIDDTPEAVILSGFDMVRREIAKRTLEKLIEDGRIHPGRIEELVEKVKKEMDEQIREIGEQAAFDVGIHGLDPELIYYIGRLKYRTSYGQNVLQHSIEVANIMGIMASELGLDVQIAKRVGLLHDIGKAMTHEVEGPHAEIGADLAKKFGEPAVVINSIGAHHGDIEATTIYGILASSADAISAARPGARAETLQAYIKRLEQLETLAAEFGGVDKAYAIQAGREIRVIVSPDQLNDDDSIVLARNVANKIQDELEYPGQIKVTVIRETRCVEYAK